MVFDMVIKFWKMKSSGNTDNYTETKKKYKKMSKLDIYCYPANSHTPKQPSFLRTNILILKCIAIGAQLLNDI